MLYIFKISINEKYYWSSLSDNETCFCVVFSLLGGQLTQMEVMEIQHVLHICPKNHVLNFCSP